MDEAILNNRSERKRKLVPTLKLKYPSIDELAKIASLARVEKSERAKFGTLVMGAIFDAHLNAASTKGQSIPKAKKMLEILGTKAAQLCNALQKIDIDLSLSVPACGTKQLAGRTLEYEIGKSRFKGNLVLIPEYVELLTALNKASLQAAETLKAKRGPKGAAGSRAFPTLVEGLEMAARNSRGSWTNYPLDGNGPFAGSFVDALVILRPYLPKKFFPHGDLGRSVKYIRDKLHKRMTKNGAFET